MIKNSSLWVVSDVDGTLMDHSYDLTPAKETIKTLQKLIYTCNYLYKQDGSRGKSY